MPHTATITPATVALTDSSMPSESFSSGSVTVAGCLQPSTSSESINYQRDTGRVLYDFYFAPRTTAGVALSFTLMQYKSAVVVVNGITYRAVGPAMDPITNGCLYHLVLEVDA